LHPLLINKLIAIHQILEPRFRAKRVSGYALHESVDILQDATSAEQGEISAHNEINRIHFYFQRTRYAFKSSMPLYCFVAFCYFGIASLYQIALWLGLTVLGELILFLATRNFDVEKVTQPQAKKSELMANFIHAVIGLIWSSGGYLLATHSAVPLQMQYLHVIFGVALCAFAVPMMTYSLRGLMAYVICASVFNLYYLIQHYDTLYLWFYGYLGLIASCAHIGYQMHSQAKELIHTSALNDLMSLRLSVQNEELHQHANIDALTGLHNRRYVVDQFEKMYSKATRYHTACTILLIDIDYFKKVNDVHGHLVGDSVLVEVAQLLVGGLRDSDLIGRYGGEEFLALLPMTNLMEAQVLAERLRAQVEKSEQIKLKQGFGVTVSIGVAQITDRDTQKQLIQRADEALYRAKAAGRNQVVLG
jgi:diguanylate cyclase (GGDEF)-like protein